MVAQHIQLQEVGLHGVIFKVGGNDVCPRVVGGVLHRAKVVNFSVLGDNHHTAWVLAGGALHPGTALSQTVFLRPRGIAAPLLHVFFHIAEGRLFRLSGVRLS